MENRKHDCEENIIIRILCICTCVCEYKYPSLIAFRYSISFRTHEKDRILTNRPFNAYVYVGKQTFKSALNFYGKLLRVHKQRNHSCYSQCSPRMHVRIKISMPFLVKIKSHYDRMESLIKAYIKRETIKTK